jgi:hypothetical protein
MSRKYLPDPAVANMALELSSQTHIACISAAISAADPNGMWRGFLSDYQEGPRFCVITLPVGRLKTKEEFSNMRGAYQVPLYIARE